MDERIINPRYPTPPFSLQLDHRIGGLKVWETVPESSWQPLVLLIMRMPALLHVVHNCASVVPLNLLAALEHQRCKLHVNTLRIPELDNPLDTAFSTLITSSALTSIRAAYLPTSMLQGTRLPATVESWYDEEALMRLVAGVTPKLTKLTILRKHGGILPTGTSKVPWDGFQLSGQDLPGLCPGKLEELALLHPNIIDLENIRAWGTHVILEVLQVLKISSPTTAEALYYLSNEILTHLSELSFAVYKKQSRPDPTVQAANHFLLTLRPLSVLRLDQNVQGLSLVRIVAHHATCLRKLWLLPVKELDSHNLASAEYYIPSLEVLEELKKSCFGLEDLAISVRRSRGSKTEIDAYRLLGSLENLRFLSLNLDASDMSVLWIYETAERDEYVRSGLWPPPPDDPTFNDFDREIYPRTFIGHGPGIRNGHMRDAFINSALDESLARTIFNIISSAGSPSRPKLERMNLHTSGGGVFTTQTSLHPYIAMIVKELGRSWVLERSRRDDRRDEIIACEASQIRAGLSSSNIDPSWSKALHNPEREVFKRIWPYEEETKWRNAWHSYPLTSN
jgi:hypothetical protein